MRYWMALKVIDVFKIPDHFNNVFTVFLLIFTSYYNHGFPPRLQMWLSVDVILSCSWECSPYTLAWFTMTASPSPSTSSALPGVFGPCFSPTGLGSMYAGRLHALKSSCALFHSDSCFFMSEMKHCMSITIFSWTHLCQEFILDTRMCLESTRSVRVKSSENLSLVIFYVGIYFSWSFSCYCFALNLRHMILTCLYNDYRVWIEVWLSYCVLFTRWQDLDVLMPCINNQIWS